MTRLGVDWRLLLATVACVLLLVASITIANWPSTQSSAEPSAKRAVIVDQLSLTDPNPHFIAAAGALLTQAGYEVDYYGGPQVTLDLYRELPSRDYSFVVLRTHSARRVDEAGLPGGEASLFTAEFYTPDMHTAEQQRGEVGTVRYAGRAERFFGVRPKFIAERTRGRFPSDAVVVLMGCDGMRSATMAEAFVARGAAAFVGWDAQVSAEQTDAATERLLWHMLVGDRPVGDAVERTMGEVGSDPVNGGRLVTYPERVLASGSMDKHR